MQGTYKLFAAAVLGLAMIFASMEVADRIGQDQPVAVPAKSKTAEPAADAPKPVIVPAPDAPPPLDPAVATAPSELKVDAPEVPPAATAPAMTGEGEAPAPMIILPAEGQ